MNTRMDKYENSVDPKMSRTARNHDLYQTINKNEIENYEIKSNATVLGSNDKNQIDVEQIKKILDTRYNEAPKRRSIRLAEEKPVEPVHEETTKEYDINAIIEKAKNEKPLSYEEERIKKLRDTQYNILNDLKIDSEDQETTSENQLLDLINTITLNEEKTKAKEVKDETDLFADLKGDDSTETFEAMQEKLEETRGDLEETKTEEKTINLDNSTFSKSLEFTKKDFEDLDIDSDKTGIFGKILIVVILIAFVVGIFIFLKSIFNF
jgi:hypothetical protein